MMVEVCADIANHIIADRALPVPHSYADCFKVLSNSQILTSALSSTMQEMARFRNIIVHGYDKVDETIVVGILQRRLGGFLAYRDAILDYLKRET